MNQAISKSSSSHSPSMRNEYLPILAGIKILNWAWYLRKVRASAVLLALIVGRPWMVLPRGQQRSCWSNLDWQIYRKLFLWKLQGSFLIDSGMQKSDIEAVDVPCKFAKIMSCWSKFYWKFYFHNLAWNQLCAKCICAPRSTQRGALHYQIVILLLRKLVGRNATGQPDYLACPLMARKIWWSLHRTDTFQCNLIKGEIFHTFINLNMRFYPRALSLLRGNWNWSLYFPWHLSTGYRLRVRPRR